MMTFTSIERSPYRRAVEQRAVAGPNVLMAKVDVTVDEADLNTAYFQRLLRGFQRQKSSLFLWVAIKQFFNRIYRPTTALVSFFSTFSSWL